MIFRYEYGFHLHMSIVVLDLHVADFRKTTHNLNEVRYDSGTGDSKQKLRGTCVSTDC